MTILPSFPSRRSTFAALLLSILAGALLWLAAPAGAIVTEVSGTSVGLQPRTTEIETGDPSSFENEAGNAVLHGTNIYTVYWDPKSVFQQEWLIKLNGFFHNLGAGSGDLATIFAPLIQYRDRTNTGANYQTTFMGSYSDTTKYPAAGCTDPAPLAVGAITCLTDAQLREHLAAFIPAHGTPKGMHAIYYVLTPPGVTVCVDAAATRCSDYSGEPVAKNESYSQSFCSYHGAINPDKATEGDGNTVLYAAIPWSAAGTIGLFKAVSDTKAHAQGFFCQDGGWNPEKRSETYEHPKPMTEGELESFNKAGPEEKAKIIKQRELEEPHEEQPGQEGLSPRGDYGAGLTDVLIGQIATEQANIVSDPLLNAWQNAEQLEATDLCRNVFANTVGSSLGGSVAADEFTRAGSLFNEEIGGSNYYINNIWSLGSQHCEGGVALAARFTLPNPVNNNEIVGLNGMESTVGLSEGREFGPSGPPKLFYATYSWNFGDGTPEVKGYAPGAPPCEAPWLSPCAGSTFHTYQYGGKYTVTLTITDVGGYVSSDSQSLQVNGPGAPAATPTPTPGSPAGTVTKPGSTPGGPTAVNPVAAATVLSRSLKTALRKGLSVRYSVNEQVAGHFEVMISSALARKLKLRGTPVTGLPAGTPPQVMIAKAFLVTTKAGASTIQINFSKTVAARLRKAHSVKGLLRMFVRNAASKSPATSTVLSSITLG